MIPARPAGAAIALQIRSRLVKSYSRGMIATKETTCARHLKSKCRLQLEIFQPRLVWVSRITSAYQKTVLFQLLRSMLLEKRGRPHGYQAACPPLIGAVQIPIFLQTELFS
jgi:hypothetical protein